MPGPKRRTLSTGNGFVCNENIPAISRDEAEALLGGTISEALWDAIGRRLHLMQVDIYIEKSADAASPDRGGYERQRRDAEKRLARAHEAVLGIDELFALKASQNVGPAEAFLPDVLATATRALRHARLLVSDAKPQMHRYSSAAEARAGCAVDLLGLLSEAGVRVTLTGWSEVQKNTESDEDDWRLSFEDLTGAERLLHALPIREHQASPSSFARWLRDAIKRNLRS